MEETKQKLKDLEQKSEKAEQENEIYRNLGDFVRRFLYKLAIKFNFESIEGFCAAYKYDEKNSDLKRKIKALLSIFNMKIEDFEKLQQFKLESGVKRQTEEEAQQMLEAMKFPDNMIDFKSPINRALKALKTWKYKSL